MKDGAPWTLVAGIIILVIAFIGVIISAAINGECTSAKKGELRTPYHGGRVEVCNGYAWVPYRVELPK